MKKKSNYKLIFALGICLTFITNKTVNAETTLDSVTVGENIVESSSLYNEKEQLNSTGESLSVSEQGNDNTETVVDSETIENSKSESMNKEDTSSSTESLPAAISEVPDSQMPSGRSDLYVTNESTEKTLNARSMARAATLSLPNINHDDPNTPTKDFIDVSSHNGIISVDSYKMMKKYGVKGVVVKLTEYTTYRNPYAESQIKNAQAAGLAVHVYHYSWFTSNTEARQEADYFAKFANELKLPKNTIMVNDIEEPKIAGKGDHTANSLAFANRLKELGFTNTQHYIGLYWLTSGRVNAKTLGEKNIWVAAYPYSPTKEQQYTQYSAWQWSSQVYYPGINSPFDMSSDYAKKFTTVSSNSTNPAEYYTTNPGYIVMKKNDYIYLDTTFSDSTRGTKINKDQIFKVNGIAYSGKTPRLIISGGYLTANKKYVNKIVSNYNNYLYTVPTSGYVYTKKNDSSYTTTAFTTKKTKYNKGSVLKVIGIEFSSDGYPRLKLDNGAFYTANKNNVGILTKSYANYYLTNPNYVALKKNDYYYKDLAFNQRGSKITKGSVVKISGISYTSSGVPRLVTSKGYLTANKNYVAKITSKYANYYTNVKKVKFLKDDYYYTSTNFVSQNRSTKIKKGQVVTVTGTDFDANGYPRLKTANDYITANKAYVREQ